MAEAILRELLRQKGAADAFEIASAAISDEEWGNPIYPPAARILRVHGVPYDAFRTAHPMTVADYSHYDLIIGMDESNLRGIRRISGGDPGRKARLLMDYAGQHRSVADPWYTRDFETAYNDIVTGCQALLKDLGL